MSVGGKDDMKPQVGVIMGSKSDWETMKHACELLEQLEIPYEKSVVSAHRTPDLMFEYAESERKRNKGDYCRSWRCGAFTWMVAAKTTLP